MEMETIGMCNIIFSGDKIHRDIFKFGLPG